MQHLCLIEGHWQHCLHFRRNLGLVINSQAGLTFRVPTFWSQKITGNGNNITCWKCPHVSVELVSWKDGICQPGWVKGPEDWVIAKGPCSALSLITLQRFSKWNALTESWGHWKVSDWHVDRLTSLKCPRWINRFNCTKSAGINEPTSLEVEM